VGKIFHSNFTLHVCARLAQPYDAELGLGALILKIDNVAGFELRAYALQSGAAAADGAQAGRLRKGTGVSVHTPNLNGKFDENALLAAAIHKCWVPLLIRLASAMVKGVGGETQVTGVTGLRYRKF